MQTVDFSSFAHLRVRTGGDSNVWSVRLPRMPWNYAAADRERWALVEKMSMGAPERWLWLGPLISDGNSGWQPVAPSDNVCERLPLREGEWALLIFEGEPPLPLPSVAFPLADAKSLNAFLIRCSASAAIVSLVDDDEWLVAVATQHDARGSASLAEQ